MTDLAVLVPSRGRPANVARLVEACAKTCRADTMVVFGFDDDDPAITENKNAATEKDAEHGWSIASVTGPRHGLSGWTNLLAESIINGFDPSYLASLGDDMVPVTDGWDELLITRLAGSGGGFAYPDDKRRQDIPEAVVISTPIVRALGWICLPALNHWYVDNVWADLGRGAGCLHFCPDVIVEHRHPAVDPRTRTDATYTDASASFNADAAAYRRWRLYQMAADIATVGRVREECWNSRSSAT